jgi:hypothetical protein
MQQQYTTFEIILQFLIGMTPTILLILFVVFIYFRGKRNNAKLVQKTLQSLEDYFSPIATEFIEQNKSASGFTYKLTLKRPTGDNEILKDIKQIRIHFSLEDRHTILSFLKLLFKSPKDYFIIEGDPTTKNNHLRIEIADVFSFSKFELEKMEKEWEGMVDFEPKSKFSSKFYHKTNHPKALKFLYDQNPELKKYIYNLKGLFRISVKRKTEWGFRLAIIIDKKDDKQFLLAREITLKMIKGLSDTNKAIIKQPKRLIG